MKNVTKIAFGGGCHWCTEAVFQALKGVKKVEQGYVASLGEQSSFSEAVIVHYNTSELDLTTLIEIHLNTHKSTSNHTMRTKYRSAIYVFSNTQGEVARRIVKGFQAQFDYKIITKVYPFKSFKASREEITNYYKKNPEKPFCKTYIKPKLGLLLNKFPEYLLP